MRKIALVAMAMLCACPVFSDAKSPKKAAESCQTAKCTAGQTTTTYATRSEPYFACPTRELSDYTNMVLGLVALTAQFGGSMPNISPETGEPEFRDDANGPNKTRQMLAYYRGKAKVSTFDQAVALCAEGRSGFKVTILNIRDDEMSTWVHDSKRNVSYWLPRGALNAQ